MSNSQSGIGEKLLEAGASTVKAGVNEVKTTVSTALEQVTGQPIKTDSELRAIAQTDKDTSSARIGQIQKELAAQQKMRRFHEIRETGASPTLPASEPSRQDLHRNAPERISSPTQKPLQPLSVKQTVGKAEQGRNFKG